MRTGITTGTCAAAAAKAAAQLLSGQTPPQSVKINLPDGGKVYVPILYVKLTASGVEAAVKKNAGDDPDITNGVSVIVNASWANGYESLLVAGPGVGTVTLPGLSVAPGEPAINPVPRQMILQAVREVTAVPLQLLISIPGGEELAKKTFNPRLGIVGGLSLLGTSGRVVPRSAAALQSTIACCLNVAISGNIIAPVLVPGNIGRRTAERHFSLSRQQVIEVGNSWADALDQSCERGFKHLLLLGHPGKLAKLANQEWDTHSSRSSSSVKIVFDLAKQIAPHVVTDSLVTDSRTVERLFAVFSDLDKSRVATSLASKVQAAVVERVANRFYVAVTLIDLAGNILATQGDLQPWLKVPD